MNRTSDFAFVLDEETRLNEKSIQLIYSYGSSLANLIAKRENLNHFWLFDDFDKHPFHECATGGRMLQTREVETNTAVYKINIPFEHRDAWMNVQHLFYNSICHLEEYARLFRSAKSHVSVVICALKSLTEFAIDHTRNWHDFNSHRVVTVNNGQVWPLMKMYELTRRQCVSALEKGVPIDYETYDNILHTITVMDDTFKKMKMACGFNGNEHAYLLYFMIDANSFATDNQNEKCIPLRCERLSIQKQIKTFHNHSGLL